MNTWWDELSKKSHRDQLSFNYSIWKNNAKDIMYLMDRNIYKSKWFQWYPTGHNIKQKQGYLK